MNTRSDISKKVDKTLESLDGIQRAEPAPFLFTRVKARLDRDGHNIWETAGSFITRPAIALAGLVLILCINAFVLFEKGTTTNQSSVNFQNPIPVEEYALSDVNSNYLENIEP